MKNNNQLGARLSAIAAQVRKGVTIYDVGTDHAYLPVALVLSGVTDKAVASDIAICPLERAKQNILDSGVAGKVSTVLTSGLDGIMLDDTSDIVIAGMGGEMIASIIGAKPDIRSGDKRLILQPMTKADFLRAYLADNGFEILKEFIVEDGKLYPIIVCRSGERYCISDEEKYVGKHGARIEDELFFRYVKKITDSLIIAVNGRKTAGIISQNDSELVIALEKLIAEAKEDL